MTNAQTRKLNQKISRRLSKFPVDSQDFQEEKNNSSTFLGSPGVLDTL